MKKDSFKIHGWARFEAQVPGALLVRLRNDLVAAYDVCREHQSRSGLSRETLGTLHHILGQGQSFEDFLESFALAGFIEDYFRSSIILNSFGGVINTAEQDVYLQRVHRDACAFSPEFPLMVNVLVLLDDFTLENGATHFLSGSHRRKEKPTDEEMIGAHRAVGNAGDIFVFDSNLWHAAGRNTSGTPRRALTLTFSRPFVKQQLDYPKYLGESHWRKLSPKLQQLLGCRARVPASLEEWYQPPEKRFYQEKNDGLN